MLRIVAISVGVYGGLSGIAILWHALVGAEPIGRWLLGRDPAAGLRLGAWVALAVLLFSVVSARSFAWARELEQAFRSLLGDPGGREILLLALLSSVGEELFFRGLIQTCIGLIPTAVVFGLLHTIPQRTFLPWTIFALLMGLVLGLLQARTGGLLAPIVCHFLVNFVNLHRIVRGRRSGGPARVDPERGTDAPTTGTGSS